MISSRVAEWRDLERSNCPDSDAARAVSSGSGVEAMV